MQGQAGRHAHYWQPAGLPGSHVLCPPPAQPPSPPGPLLLSLPPSPPHPPTPLQPRTPAASSAAGCWPVCGSCGAALRRASPSCGTSMGTRETCAPQNCSMEAVERCACTRGTQAGGLGCMRGQAGRRAAGKLDEERRCPLPAPACALLLWRSTTAVRPCAAGHGGAAGGAGTVPGRAVARCRWAAVHLGPFSNSTACACAHRACPATSTRA